MTCRRMQTQAAVEYRPVYRATLKTGPGEGCLRRGRGHVQPSNVSRYPAVHADGSHLLAQV